jgi:predicted dehydrogenase
MNLNQSAPTSRREFIKTSAVISTALAAPAILSGKAFAAENSETLRIGLIGCGGRGTGAAGQALSADKNVVLAAMGDAFPEKIQDSLNALEREGAEKGFTDRIKVAPEKRFAGLDAYQKVIENVDVVLLTTPPGFRPIHLRAAVEAGKHVFCEKPVATDAPGLRSVIESAKIAKEKKLSLVCGFCWRYDFARRDLYKQIHDGAIGDIRAIYATYYTGPVKKMPAPDTRRPDEGDLEWQIRNWYNFTWLSGDGYVEQCCHSVDKVAWAMKDASPIKAVAVGGRDTQNYQGNIYDHMFVVYLFDNDVRAFVGQRQISNCFNENADFIMGSDGVAKISGGISIHGKTNWHYRGPKNAMYQQEHDELFASIRKGEAKNDGDWMSHSTMMGLMGRMAAYTGQEVTWEEAFNSKEKIVPDIFDWKMKLPIAPMPVPGFTKLV